MEKILNRSDPEDLDPEDLNRSDPEDPLPRGPRWTPRTPLRLSMYFLPSAIAIAVAPNSRSSAISSISLSMASLIRLPRE